MSNETKRDSNMKYRNTLKKEFIAHSKNLHGDSHLLKDHLLTTAELSRSFSTSKEFEQLFYITGLLHDVGKYQDGFQKYLDYGKPKTPHAGIGAFIAKELYNKLIPLQFAIQGHHAGMPDNQYRKSNNEKYDQNKDVTKELINRFCENVPEFLNLNSDIQPFSSKELLTVECITRFIFSALTDADWLDTENHFDPEKSRSRLTKELNYDDFLKAIEKEFKHLPNKGKINQLRTQARTETTKNFAMPPGFFSLQLPTGLGKTLTSMYWALLHAQENKLKRIIIVLPYINIIDQTALILKELFGEEVVLEHHSGIIEDDEQYSNENFKKGTSSNKHLACENWQAPIIITTAVQFFESLFSNRPFKCRKNHSIANSVVIFDEVQTLPKHLAEPTILMLKNIASIAKTSFLFCTATMPAFQKRDRFDGIDSTTPLIKKPKIYFDATQRVNYKIINKLKPIAIDTVIEKLLKEKGSYLVIVNTKSVATELYTQLRAGNTYEHYYHLSTAMCPDHRKKTINNIVKNLNSKSKIKIAVVSTQLVEAGVDFDFPCVYRAIAPLDSIIQSAGRCNRNGRMKKGKVVLFDLIDHRMPDNTYRSCAEFAKGIICDDPDILHRAEAFGQYYEQVIELFVTPDRFGITEERKNFNFKTVKEQYRIIESRTASLFITNYSSESKELLKDILESFENKGFLLNEQYRKLQQYSVQVYPNFLNKYVDQIETHDSGIRIWHGGYNENLGLVPENVETVF